MDDGQVIYYGVQLLVAHVRDKLGPDRLFCTRPLASRWTTGRAPSGRRAPASSASTRSGWPRALPGTPRRSRSWAACSTRSQSRRSTSTPVPLRPVPRGRPARRDRRASREAALVAFRGTPKFDIHLTKDLGFAVIANRRIPENVLPTSYPVTTSTPGSAGCRPNCVTSHQRGPQLCPQRFDGDRRRYRQDRSNKPRGALPRESVSLR